MKQIGEDTWKIPAGKYEDLVKVLEDNGFMICNTGAIYPLNEWGSIKKETLFFPPSFLFIDNVYLSNYTKRNVDYQRELTKIYDKF